MHLSPHKIGATELRRSSSSNALYLASVDAHLLRWLAHLREVQISDCNIDLFDLEPGHRKNAAGNIVADGIGNLRNTDTIIHHYIQIDCRLPLAYFDMYSSRAHIPAGCACQTTHSFASAR